MRKFTQTEVFLSPLFSFLFSKFLVIFSVCVFLYDDFEFGFVQIPEKAFSFT